MFQNILLFQFPLNFFSFSTATPKAKETRSLHYFKIRRETTKFIRKYLKEFKITNLHFTFQIHMYL